MKLSRQHKLIYMSYFVIISFGQRMPLFWNIYFTQFSNGHKKTKCGFRLNDVSHKIYDDFFRLVTFFLSFCFLWHINWSLFFSFHFFRSISSVYNNVIRLKNGAKVTVHSIFTEILFCVFFSSLGNRTEQICKTNIE